MLPRTRTEFWSTVAYLAMVLCAALLAVGSYRANDAGAGLWALSIGPLVLVTLPLSLVLPLIEADYLTDVALLCGAGLVNALLALSLLHRRWPARERQP